MKKILITYFSFILACIVVIAAFITASTYVHLAIAVLLYPVFIVFAYIVLPKSWSIFTTRPSNLQTAQINPFPQSAKLNDNFAPPTGNGISISDIDKRVFLKLIGGAGLFLFLFSLFNKRTESVFFRNLADQYKVNTGEKNNEPSEEQIIDGYVITEIDNNDVVSYYGFTNKNGSWYIMREDPEIGSFRYTQGVSNFVNNWNNRAKLQYNYFSEVFKN